MVPNQYTRCPEEIRTQREGHRLQTKERVLRRKHSCHPLDLRLWPPELWDKTFLLSYPPVCDPLPWQPKQTKTSPHSLKHSLFLDPLQEFHTELSSEWSLIQEAGREAEQLLVYFGYRTPSLTVYFGYKTQHMTNVFVNYLSVMITLPPLKVGPTGAQEGVRWTDADLPDCRQS